MRITIVTGAFLPVPPIMGGAVEKFWDAAGREFASRGHQVTHISRAVGSLPRHETLGGVEHIRVRGFDTPPTLWWLKVLDLIYSLKVRCVLPSADVLVTNTFWLPLLAVGEKHGRLYVHVARVPKGQMRFYRGASRFQAPSSAVAEAIAEEAPSLREKIVVLPYALPSPLSVEPPPPLETRARIVLFVGRVHPEKGVHLLVEAFMQERDRALAGWRLRIVGPTNLSEGGGGESYLRQLRDLAAGSEQVEFAGPIFEPLALERAYRAARLFVYPSLAERGETFGLAALEAMLHQCAVLVSDIACFRDFIDDGVTGFVFDHRALDPIQTLRARLAQLVEDEALLSRVAVEAARKSERYKVAKVADRFLEDFARLS